MARARSEIVHIRELITQRGEAGETMGPSMVFRWQRRPDPAGIKMTVLQQAWVDTQGGVHWRDIPVVDA